MNLLNKINDEFVLNSNYNNKKKNNNLTFMNFEKKKNNLTNGIKTLDRNIYQKKLDKNKNVQESLSVLFNNLKNNVFFEKQNSNDKCENIVKNNSENNNEEINNEEINNELSKITQHHLNKYYTVLNHNKSQSESIQSNGTSCYSQEISNIVSNSSPNSKIESSNVDTKIDEFKSNNHSVTGYFDAFDKKNESNNCNGIDADNKSILNSNTDYLKDRPKSLYKKNLIENWNSKDEKKKFKILIIILIFLCLFLVLTFVPTIIILSLGTKKSVNNFLKSFDNRQKIFKYLKDYESDESNNHLLSRINKIEGLNPKFKNDIEIKNLMTDSNGLSFYGLAYSPRNVIDPICGIKKRDVMLDLAKISTVTSRIKNYGMQCDQSDIILDSIQTLNLNMTLSMGVWIGENDDVNDQQINLMLDVLKKYPRKYFENIFIGNEVLFREDKTSKELVHIIKNLKKKIKSLGYYDLPIGTTEIGSLINDDLLDNLDIVGANVHPFFSGTNVQSATDWTLDFYVNEVINYKKHEKKIYLTEVGWPSGGGTFNSSVASNETFNYFLNDFLCKSKSFNFSWYFFEAFDEPWKETFYTDGNTWETQWGIFTNDRKNKFSMNAIGKC